MTMKTYARMVDDGRVGELFPPVVAEEDVFVPGEPLPDGSPGEPVLRYAAGQEIPIEDRFHPDIVAQLVEYDPANPPPEPEPEPPVVVVPFQVTMRQARLALLAAGKLQLVDAAIEQLPSPQKEGAAIEWEFAATVDRASPIVALLASALDLNEAELDALFTEAAAL